MGAELKGRQLMGLAAILLAGGSAAAQGAQAPRATTEDIADFKDSRSTHRSYPQFGIGAWESDLRSALAKGSLDGAADVIAAKYGFTPSEMRRLANDWVISQAHQYLPHDRRWVRGVRADMLNLLPTMRRAPLGLVIIAETLGATDTGDKCPAENFDPLITGASDVATAAYIVASATTCQDNFTRAALAAPDRAMPVLIRMADWGGLSLDGQLPLYGWLTSDAGLSRIADKDRPAVSALLWQRYLALLLKVGLDAKALALFDGLAPDLRARVVSPRNVVLEAVPIDGIVMSFGQTEGDDKNAATTTSAPILALAQALAAAHRETEARDLLATLPGLDAARRVSDCMFDPRSARCDDTNHLPMAALTLDHLLNHPGEDPYAVAETTLSNGAATETVAGAEIRCRVFPEDRFPTLCKDGRESAFGNLSVDKNGGVLFDEIPQLDEVEDRAEVALTRAVPGFAASRRAFADEATALYGSVVAAKSRQSYARATVPAVPPSFTERRITAQGAVRRVPPPKGLGALPNGFLMVRAERDGTRVVAISLSQMFDPTGEVSGGGYWVHLSTDGGAHWRPPLYTGLADHFPYVVVEQSPMPMLSGDTLNLAVDIAEIDTASIGYPPVGLRTRRNAKGLYLEIPLADLRRDSDGDGLSDIAAHHLLLDRARRDGGTPFIIGSDDGDNCPAAPSVEQQTRIALLGKLFDPSDAAIVEPVNRPTGEIAIGSKRAAAPADRPLFLLGDPKDYRCLHANRLIVIYSTEDIAAIEHFTPDFHPFALPPISWNAAHDRGFGAWSTGWAGGTYRLRLVDGQWQFDALGSWIT